MGTRSEKYSKYTTNLVKWSTDILIDISTHLPLMIPQPTNSSATEIPPQSSLYITPAGSAEKITELALSETQQLDNNPFCQAQLEFLPLLDGLELLTVHNAQILQDLSVYTVGNTPALGFNVALSGYYGVQLSGASSLLQQPQTVLCGYHPELNDTFYCPKQSHLQVVAFGITCSTLNQLAAGQSLPKALYPLLDNPETAVVMLPMIPLKPQLLTIVRQLFTCPYTAAIKQFYLQGKALELFALYLTLFDERKSLPKRSRLKPRDVNLIHEAKDYLLAAMQNPPSLIELARVVGTNQDKLKRGFREVFGTTVFGYLREVRLDEAYQLLLNNDLTVKAVATQVGYADSKHFAKVFKAKFGDSPLAVRRKA
jgi:AraC-like DNA-binding protein